MQITIQFFSKTPAYLAGVFALMCVSYLSDAQNVTRDLTLHNFNIFDADGKLFVNPYIDVAGSPFFLDEWKFGTIVLNDNKKFTDVHLRLNLQTQEVHFLKPDKNELVTPVGLVKEINLFDTVNNVPVVYIFQRGFPAIDNQNVLNFYQVLGNGKIKFLESLRKVIHQEKNEYAGTIEKEFRQYEDFYFFTDNKIERIKRDKAYVLSFMKDKNDLINDFVKRNKLSFKSTEDIKKIIDYYNSLF
jgi:hypothetical protein